MNIDMEHYDNEGFFYLNKHSTETFIKGEIRDINNTLICPGVIVPIINPIYEANHEAFTDDNTQLVSMESCLPYITHFYPLQKGKKIRIYWNHNNDMFMVSTEHKIYTYSDPDFYLDTVNFDLLDKQLCYYAIASSTEQKLILTNIVQKTQPDLLTSYDIYEDLAFAHHIGKELVKCEVDTLTVIKIIDEQLNHFENGVLFILDDGRQVEYRNQKYSYYCMLEKPETMSIYIYFILALNRYAAGATFTDYFTSLHEYIQEYLDFFPEYTRQFQYMTAALENYVAAECTDQSTSDHAKIETIQKLLEIVPEELLLLLIEY
jgi:hypothetical protein